MFLRGHLGIAEPYIKFKVFQQVQVQQAISRLRRKTFYLRISKGIIPRDLPASGTPEWKQSKLYPENWSVIRISTRP